jgi:periplasmic protein TonB
MPWPQSLWIPRPGTAGAEPVSTADSGCRGIPLAALALALAAHAAVVGLLWRGPGVSPPAPAVLVQLIVRPAPEPSPAPAPQATPVEAPPAPARPEARPEPGPPARPDAPPAPEARPEPMPQPRPKPEPAAAPPPAAELEARTGLAAAPPAPSPAAPVPAAAPPAVPDLAVQCPHRPPPRYPPAARRLGQEGVVELLVELSTSGAVTGVTLVESSGAASLDRAAVAAVRGWRCLPARAATGTPPARARQRIRFSLR